MPEIIVKYKSKRTLDALRDFAKYFDYTIASPESNEEDKKQVTVNGVTMISADSSVNTSDASHIFTGKDLDAKQLRDEAWQRKK